jgi:hypothetical protein
MTDKVIVRANMSGVWYGELVDHADDFSWVLLREALHLWSWQTKQGVSCAALAVNGIDLAKSKVSPAVTVVVRDPCEIIEVASDAESSFVG